MKYEQMNLIASEVAQMYGIYKSCDVASSLGDYLTDLQIKVNYENFRMMCLNISKESKVMIPKIIDMKRSHKLSQEVANGI